MTEILNGDVLKNFVELQQKVKSEFGLNPRESPCMFQNQRADFLRNSIQDIAESNRFQILLIVDPRTRVQRKGKEEKNFVIKIFPARDVSH